MYYNKRKIRKLGRSFSKRNGGKIYPKMIGLNIICALYESGMSEEKANKLLNQVLKED